MSNSHRSHRSDGTANAARKSIKFLNANNDDDTTINTTIAGPAAAIVDKQAGFQSLLFGSNASSRSSRSIRMMSNSRSSSINENNSRAVARAMAALTRGVGAVELLHHHHTTISTTTATNSNNRMITGDVNGSSSSSSSMIMSVPQSRASSVAAAAAVAEVVSSNTASLVSLSRPQSRAATAAILRDTDDTAAAGSFKGGGSVKGGDGRMRSNKSSTATAAYSSKLQSRLQRLREINSGSKELAVCTKYGSSQALSAAELQADSYLSVLYRTKYEERTRQELIARREGRQLMYRGIVQATCSRLTVLHCGVSGWCK